MIYQCPYVDCKETMELGDDQAIGSFVAECPCPRQRPIHCQASVLLDIQADPGVELEAESGTLIPVADTNPFLNQDQEDLMGWKPVESRIEYQKAVARFPTHSIEVHALELLASLAALAAIYGHETERPADAEPSPVSQNTMSRALGEIVFHVEKLESLRTAPPDPTGPPRGQDLDPIQRLLTLVVESVDYFAIPRVAGGVLPAVDAVEVAIWSQSFNSDFYYFALEPLLLDAEATWGSIWTDDLERRKS